MIGAWYLVILKKILPLYNNIFIFVESLNFLRERSLFEKKSTFRFSIDSHPGLQFFSKPTSLLPCRDLIHRSNKPISTEWETWKINELSHHGWIQIKLLEVWKSQYSETYPIKWTSRNDAIQDRRTRSSNENLLHKSFGCRILNSTFINDSARIWNLVPNSIKASATISWAKKNIKNYILNLPI